MLIKLLAILLLVPGLLSADMVARSYKDSDKDVARKGRVIDSYISIDSIKPYGRGPKVIIYARRWPDSVATIMYGTDTSKTKFTIILPLVKDSVEIVPDSTGKTHRQVWWNKNTRLEDKPVDALKLKVSGDSLSAK